MRACGWRRRRGLSVPDHIRSIISFLSQGRNIVGDRARPNGGWLMEIATADARSTQYATHAEPVDVANAFLANHRLQSASVTLITAPFPHLLYASLHGLDDPDPNQNGGASHADLFGRSERDASSC